MDYFVYLHRKSSNGAVFYVGKGCRYRHKSTWNRSVFWRNIVKKHGYYVEIVQSGMQEWWAFELERDLILRYKDNGLCNLTDGGEGASGCVASEETKRKHKERRWSDEWRQNISVKAKMRFADPAYKSRHQKLIRSVMERPEVKAKLREAALRQFSNPEAREQARAKTLKHFSDPKAVEVTRMKALERFNTPAKRASHAQAKRLRCIENSMEFGTTTLAAEWVSSWRGAKSDNSQIAKACRGILKTAYGLHWEYVTCPKEVSAK